MVYPETKKIKINQNKLKGVGGEKPINDQAGRPAPTSTSEVPKDPCPPTQGRIKRGLGGYQISYVFIMRVRGGRDMQLDGYIFI